MKKQIILFSALLMCIMLTSCGNEAYIYGYFLHNNTGHTITIVNTESATAHNDGATHDFYQYDSVLVQNGAYYFLDIDGSFDKPHHNKMSTINEMSRLYIYNNDTCFYMHPGDGENADNCLWNSAYREPNNDEKSILQSVKGNIVVNYYYVFDLTDGNIRAEIHRP